MFNPSEWTDRLIETASRPLARAMAEGAVAELMLHAAALKVRGASLNLSLAEKRTSAEEIADRLNIPIPEGVSLDFPDWLKQRIAEELKVLFAQEYWTNISVTTRNDVARTVDRGLVEGLSIRRIAKEIESQHGGDYTRARATAVARTETSGAVAAGHVQGIKRLQEETGLEMGKEWLSVLGNTTRDSHAAADGQIVGVDEDFNIGGHKAPWPSHWSLPASERVNCQCTTLSSFIGEATRDDEPEPQPEAVEVADETPKPAPAPKPSPKPKPKPQPKPTLTQDELDKLPILDALAQADSLNAKAAAVAALETTELTRLRELWEQLEKEVEELRRLKLEHPDKERRIEANRLAFEKSGELFKAKRAVEEEVKRVREKALKVLKLKKKDQAALKPSESSGLSERDDKGRLVSTGNYTSEFRSKAKAAVEFLQSLVSNRGTIKGQELSRNLRIHVSEDGCRAFQRGRGAADRVEDASRGVFISNQRPERVFVHEIGHHLENSLSGAQRRANEFVEARIKRSGKPDVKMRDVLPSHGYDAWETGNDDDFRKGISMIVREGEERDNAAYYAGKRYSTGDTEALTIGLESLFEDPVGFAKGDPEWFKFVVGVLDGTIR